ncbi:MAG: hypothetical protein SOW55_07055 [Bacilli bacterium]|nr:hypothetical protein [Bacilli bacterium]
MKKTKLLLLAALLVSGSLVSCGGKAEKMTVGVGYSGSFNATKGQLDLTAAFVAFNSKGVIVDSRLDVVQVKVAANEAKDGLTLTNKNVDANHSVTSKLELGPDYGMGGISKIGKEVDEQIEAFADWTVGKTVEEVKSKVIPGSGHGTPVAEDLTTSVTISVDAFVSAVECAYANKSTVEYDVVKDAKAGIGMISGLAYNYGKPTKELDVVVGGAMVKDGKVVAATFDQVVFPVAIAEDGTLSGDTTAKYFKDGVLKSKKVLGDAYAMKPASGIKKEWFEQAAVIDAACAGKTATEITALEKGKGELSGATMTVSSYLSAIAKAVNYAPLANIK